MSKVKVPVNQAYRLLNIGCVALLTAAYDSQQSVMALAWHMPVSIKPPLVAIAVGLTRFTAELVQKSGDFALNIPGYGLLSQTQYCGTVSGRQEDKFAGAKFVYQAGNKVKAPVISQCLVQVECKVVDQYLAGDHYIFVGQVEDAAAEEEFFNGMWKITAEEKNLPFQHLGGTSYLLPGRKVTP